MIILRSNYSVLTGLTVEDGYNWDRGLPKTFKVLQPDDNYVVGSAPYTKVKFRIITDVIPQYRLQTVLTFSADDYYTETNNITAFNPREPFHPFEDKYGAVWSWAGLATGGGRVRRTLTESFSSAAEANKIFDSLNDEEDIFEYPETSIKVLSTVPVKQATNLRPSLSNVYFDFSGGTGILTYKSQYFKPVFYERWSQTFNNNPPNLLAAVEALKATTPNVTPSFNRDLYTLSETRQPEVIDTFAQCFTANKIIFNTNTYIDETSQMLGTPQASANITNKQFNLDLTQNGILKPEYRTINPISLTPVQLLQANIYNPGTGETKYLTYKLNKINQPFRIGPTKDAPTADQRPTLWSINGLNATNYKAYAPNSTPSLSSRTGCELRMQETIDKSFFSISQFVGNYPNNTSVIASIFVKPIGELTKVRINLSGSSFDTAPCFTDWDLEAGILLQKTANVTKYQIQSVGDGWYYIAMTASTQYTGDCVYSFVILERDTYTLNVTLSGNFVFYRNDTIENKRILVWEPQFLVESELNNALYDPLKPQIPTDQNHKGKVHRISWYFTPHETSYHNFSLASDTDSVLLYCEEENERDLQNYPFDYLICRLFPDSGDQIYPESQKHWNRTSLQTKNLFLQKNKTYYFEARWWQKHFQSYIDIGWGSTDPSWKKIQWGETQSSSTYPKLWLREGYSADAEIEHVYTVPQTYSPSLSVKVNADIQKDYIYDDEDANYEALNVLENRPAAAFAVLSADYGYSPLTVEFSPRSTKPGSFPVEKIDWDFGDGTPIVTVSRHTAITGDNIIYVPNPLAKDLRDPRNYNVKHTYIRSTLTDPRIFYPSITAYSSVTDSYDSCSREIGPIGLKSKTQKDIIKTSYYGVQNNATYVFDLQGQAAVLRKDNKYKKELNVLIPTVLQTPPNRIVYENDLGTNVALNSGIGFKELINA